MSRLRGQGVTHDDAALRGIGLMAMQSRRCGAPQAAERTVTWSVSRSAGDRNTVTFSRQSGTGPSNITFGPNGGNITTQISSGAVYTRTGSTASGGRGLSFRLSGNTLQLDDNLDNDFNDLQITPSIGRFTSDSRWEANW